MSGLLNSTLNGSNSNLLDSSGRPFASSFSAQSATAPVFHHSGNIQGMHNIHGNFPIPNMPGSLGSRNSGMGGVPSSGVQQPTGSLSSGRFTSNNLPVALSQISHGSSHGHSGVTNRGGISVVGSPAFTSSSMNGIVGGSITGIPPTSAAVGNRITVPGLGVSPILGSAGPRITSTMGNIVGGGGNIGRSLSSGGGLSIPGLGSRVNLTANSGSGSLGVQGHGRLMSGVLQQAPPHVISMLGNSYSTSGGPLSQSQIQAGNNSLSSMGMLNDVGSNDSSPFDMNDFPQLTGRPSSAGGAQGQLGALRKQGVGVSSIVQQSQEFSIQNEDFPALPGFKGGNADFAMDMHQKEQQLHDSTVSMMQHQHFPMARSSGFSLGGATYRQQQQQQHAPSVSGSGGVSFSPGNSQDHLHLHGGSDLFPSSHVAYHSQSSGLPSIGLRPLNSPSSISGIGSYDQLMQQYQHHHNQSQFRLQQQISAAATQSFRDQTLKSLQGSNAQTASPDRFGLLGLLSVIRMSNPDLTSLALGIDLTTLGLNLNSADNLHKTFGSPWSDGPAKGEPEYVVPECYYNAKQPPALHQGYFSKFMLETLFYIFYSMPKDEAQLYAASELYTRGWFFHREHRLWFSRVANTETLVKQNACERGSYHCFDPNTWDTIRKDHLVIHYEHLEKRPTIPQN